MNNLIKLSANQFADALKESYPVREYIKAIDNYKHDEEINQLTEKYYTMENKMLDLLIECNDEISAVINMNFAKLAAPSTSCCS